MKRDFAVRLRLEPCPLGTELVADFLVAVELAVDDEVDVALCIGHRLIAIAETDDR